MRASFFMAVAGNPEYVATNDDFMTSSLREGADKLVQGGHATGEGAGSPDRLSRLPGVSAASHGHGKDCAGAMEDTGDENECKSASHGFSAHHGTWMMHAGSPTGLDYPCYAGGDGHICQSAQLLSQRVLPEMKEAD